MDEATQGYLLNEFNKILPQRVTLRKFLSSDKKIELVDEGGPRLIRGLQALSNVTHHLNKHFGKLDLATYKDIMFALHEATDNEKVKKILKSGSQKGSGFWSSIGNAFKSAWHGIKSAGSTVIDGIKTAANAVNKHVFRPVAEYLGAVGEKMYQHPLETLGNAASFVGDVVSGDIPGAIGDGASLITA